MRVLFVEPFDGGSHHVLLDGLRRHSRHRIEPLVLPGEAWRRRMRRGAASLADTYMSAPWSPDLVIATDMLDLPLFLAMTRRHLAGSPVLLYMHENQFTYPRIRGTKLNSWYGQINYHSALAADAVAFNSAYHRDDFLAALRTLATRPNNWLDEARIEALADKSFVLPLGLDLRRLDEVRADRHDGPVRLLWNHRWEFDKAPDLFARVVRRLADDGLPFEVAVAGEPGPNPHPALEALPAALGSRVVHHGFARTWREYAALLWSSDLVVSTTRHEFFGIGMVEALYCGCTPVAPASFTYPELVPEALHGQCLFRSESEFEARLRALVLNRPLRAASLRAAAARFDWGTMAAHWDRTLEVVAAGTPAGRRPDAGPVSVRPPGRAAVP